MKSAKPKGPFVPITQERVAELFREVWPGRNIYPEAEANRRVAILINTVVERENAAPKRKKSIGAVKKLKEKYTSAKKYARALAKDLEPILQNLHFEREMFSQINPDNPLARGAADKISMLEAMVRDIGIFQKQFAPPDMQDHMDHILWISRALEEAWQYSQARGLDEPISNVRMGKKPDDPQVAFIYMALESAGLAGEGLRGNSRETICEHLRERQNRPRNRKTAK